MTLRLTDLIPVLTGRGLVVWHSVQELERLNRGMDRELSERMAEGLGAETCECHAECRCESGRE
jgi:hypothetical protein